jgi:hypothetical protein
MSLVRTCSTPALAWCTIGFLNCGSKTKIVGTAAEPPAGGVVKTLG